MGKTPKKKPRWYVEQTERHERFRAVLEQRLERDRQIAEAAKRAQQ